MKNRVNNLVVKLSTMASLLLVSGIASAHHVLVLQQLVQQWSPGGFGG